tara:strand:+ start:310 stop:975 length:666 start_codon:yes stop_codon:yes gene_type:complete
MSGALQAVFQNLRSFVSVPVPPPTIGAAYEGGFFAGQISTAGTGVADYNLVIGPKASTQSALQWKTSNTATAGTSSIIDGPANSAAMNNATHPAAQFCEALTVGSNTDWYMPAKNELEVCYYNLKPTTGANNTVSGINTNSVPARASNYTSGNPAQTSAAAFVTSTGAEAFDATYYWTSTQDPFNSGNNFAKWQRFDNGRQYYGQKIYTYINVRAVRRVAV